ncbi:Mot1p [Rhizophagus irregularis DAOM 197198w]|uniref:Mot1p n=1 Tax=Rhizophagus irregularis (strain DAOM 197198w) TaxID=1432141 RepID=A0A015JEU9_RHIIW|nr:Mot1p [Rhizophagus irregularis DAOM 197198w]
MLSNEHPKEPTIDEEVQFWIQKEEQSKKTRYYNTIARFATIAHPNLNRGGILADDMGLGKTIQMIALIASKPAINLDSTYSKTTLIVTPLSVLDNWVDQINIHVKKGSLSSYVFHGINRNNDPEFLKDHDIIITTYAILAQSDIKERSGLLAIKWLRVILDEGHIICTKSSKQSIAACNLNAERRWILTGTPIMNELNDIFTPFDNFETWNTIFNNKTMKFKNNNNSRLNDLRNLMKTVCLRRTKDMKFNEHPIIYDKMESDTKEQFRSWKESRNGDLKNNYVTFLEMLLRLRQICNHTQLLCKRQINQINGIDNKEEIGNLNDFKISSKIEALVEFLNQNNDDDKSVVFSQWTSFLDLIEIAFKDANVKFVRFDGKMFRNQREEAVNNFNNDPEIKVLLISLKCGSLGLNLTAANQCFLMDPWWNPSIEDQAIDRIYRIGQTRPVSVFRIFIENTIEDRVFELQKKKRDLIFQAFEEQQSNESSNIDEAQLKKDLQVLLGEN